MGTIVDPGVARRDRAVSPPIAGLPLCWTSSTVRLVAVAVIAVGAALRLSTYIMRRGLWMDETLLSLNIGTRSWQALVQSLDYDQTAPFPFLWGEWFITRLAGFNVWTLHALPLMAGIALVAAVWWVGRRLIGDQAAIVATAMAAASSQLVSYSNLVKQYGGDGLVTLAVLGATIAVLRDVTAMRSWRWLALTGIAALCLSQPAAFVVAGAALVLALQPALWRSLSARRVWLFAVAAWTATLALLFTASYRPTVRNRFMQRFWEGAFLTPGAPDLSMRVRHAFLAFTATTAEGTFRSPVVLLCAALMIGGFVLLLRRQRSVGELLLAPLAALVVAATLGLYPIAPRLVLFLAPILFFATAVGVVAVVQLVPSRARAAAMALAVCLPFAVQLVPLRQTAGRPSGNDDTPAVISDVQSRAHGEPVYLSHNSVPGWLFYMTDWHAPDTARLSWIAHLTSSSGPAFGMAMPRGHSVHDEGDTYCATLAGHRVLLGVGSGLAEVNGKLVTDVLDSGWADNEARRIHAVARPDAWVILNYSDQKEFDAMRAALTASGGAITWAELRPLGAALRIHFDRPLAGPPTRCAGDELPTTRHTTR